MAVTSVESKTIGFNGQDISYSVIRAGSAPFQIKVCAPIEVVKQMAANLTRSSISWIIGAEVTCSLRQVKTITVETRKRPSHSTMETAIELSKAFDMAARYKNGLPPDFRTRKLTEVRMASTRA